MTVSGKIAIVTGSTSGIGLAIATRLAAEGCNLMLNGFGDPKDIQKIRTKLAKDNKVKVAYSSADLSKPDEISQMIREAEEDFGRVDILVNNAGIQHVAPLTEFPTDKWLKVLDIDLLAAVYTTKEVLPLMQKQNFGRIVNIVSVHGLVASPNKSAYVTAKHGMIGLTKTIALECAEQDITVNAVCPGFVETPLVRKQVEDIAKAEKLDIMEATRRFLEEKHPTRRFVPAEEVAALVAFLCGPYASSLTGASIPIDGGWTAR